MTQERVLTLNNLNETGTAMLLLRSIVENEIGANLSTLSTHLVSCPLNDRLFDVPANVLIEDFLLDRAGLSAD